MPVKALLLLGVIAITLFGIAPPPVLAAAPQVSVPDDGKGAYRSGRYRNLLAERLGVSPAETHRKIEQAFHQLFHGDGQEQRAPRDRGERLEEGLGGVEKSANVVHALTIAPPRADTGDLRAGEPRVHQKETERERPAERDAEEPDAPCEGTWLAPFRPAWDARLDALETEVYRTRRERRAAAPPAPSTKEKTA